MKRKAPRVSFEPSAPASKMIDELLASGLYGTSRSAVVRELVYRELRGLITDEMFRKLKELRR